MNTSIDLVNDTHLVESKEREGEVFKYLKQSKYQNIPDEQIALLISYCKAAKLDPLSDVAHIVSYNVQDKETKKWGKSYKIIPGIAKFRTQASRSGRYAGITEPEFGPIIEEKIGSLNVKYPEWCKITVKKLVNGIICEFEAKEYWIENYATKSREDKTPNDMWLKRPRGQLAKCTEAQALRKSNPELFGNEMTYEELQGKTIYQDDYEAHIEDQSSNVVDRIKNRMAQQGVVIDHPDIEEPKETIEQQQEQEESDKDRTEYEPEQEQVDLKLSAMFDLIRNSNKAIKSKIDDYIKNNKIEKLDNRRISFLIRKIVMQFPEINRQLSNAQKEYIESLFINGSD